MSDAVPRSGDRSGPATYFAPAERAPRSAVEEAAASVSASPVMGAALQSFGGILMILNRQRQIVAVNDDLLRFLGCDGPEHLLGLRPGEALHCVHAADNPEGGCGTGRFCRTCGAAVAIVSSQRANTPAEAECLLTATVGGRSESFEFRVRAAPIVMGGHPLVVISLQDIRDLKRREALEAVFLHDLMNTAGALQMALKLLARAGEEERGRLLGDVSELAERLIAEIAEQRDLSALEGGRFQARMTFASASEIREVVEHLFARHECAAGKRLAFECAGDGFQFITDSILLTRALANLVKNALEATPRGGEVRVACRPEDDRIVFAVWNAGAIPEDVAAHIFVRYFSTKSRHGRGLGTYGAKLIVERYLRGRLSFTSSEAEGTVFRLELPREAERTPSPS